MSKPKLNLQIRSASFKANGHAGTAVQNKTPSSKMQLLKTQWQSEDRNGTVPNSNDAAKAKLKNSENDVTATNFNERKENKPSNSASGIENHVKSVPKEFARSSAETASVNSQGLNVTKLKSESTSNDLNTQGQKEKLVPIDNKFKVPSDKSKTFAGANAQLRMKVDSLNNVSVPKTNGNLTPNSAVNSLIIKDEKKQNYNSVSAEKSSEVIKGTTVDNITVKTESKTKSSLVINDASQNINRNKEKVPYNNSSSTSDLKQLSPSLSETSLVKNGTQNSGVVKAGENSTEASSVKTGEIYRNSSSTNLSEAIKTISRNSTSTSLTDSKDSFSRNSSSSEINKTKGNMSRNSSDLKLKLPEKRKLKDDPADMIEELQVYLRKRFGSAVTETYTQVGETEKVIDDAGSGVVPESATCLSFSSETDSDRTSLASTTVSTPTSATVDRRSETFIPHPIFFKTSVKKDPGSKLHDALVSELSSVLKKREDPNSASKETGSTESSKSDVDKSKFPKKRISAKGNKVLGNKALLQHLEDHLTRTLHRNKIFQRQSLKVLGLDTIEINQENKTVDQNTNLIVPNNAGGVIPPAPVPPPPPPPPHYGAVPLNIIPKNKLEKEEKISDKSISNRNETKENPDISVVDSKTDSTSDKFVNANNSVSSLVQESNAVANEETGEKLPSDSKEDELLIYTYEHPSGRTEGVVCSVKTEENPDHSGKQRKYITCVNIVAEKSGCPFTMTVDDGGLPTASGKGLYLAEEDKPAVFNIDVGKRKGNLGVDVQGPKTIAKYSVDQQADGSFMVTYIPVEVGIFNINVTWNGHDIPGSPYNPKVVDCRKVRIIGGWQHFMDTSERVQLAVGERKQLPFDISEAGPGTLRAEVSGPSGVIDADIDTYTHGKNVVEFTPHEEGIHYIHIFWDDLPLMNSPFLGYAVPQHVDASKIILTGRGLREAVVREESEFMIDGSQAGQGSPEVTLTGIKAEVNVRIVSVGNGRFKCSYIPVVPGAYLLHINWNGRQLRGSPYKVNVIGAFYPNRVVVSGEGIHGGILGREIDVRIDTRKAGPGELTAYCMGPREVAVCELTDNHDGTFRLSIRPKEAGRHVLQVKYGGEHVQGSPFVIKVTAQPDASKVRVVGPGVEHGILATFISRFIVETKGAGAGQLTVRIKGPKGGFQVEMYRDSQRDRTILCKYDPTECGIYIISVKWSGVDIPGSPFHVHILDTQEELERALNEVSYSIKTGGSHGGSQFSHGFPQRLPYSQWREAI